MKTLTDIMPALTRPFDLNDIALKPGATTGDKTRCIAQPYADLRAYQVRLDAVAGPEQWSNSYQLLTNGVICTLTICGISKSAIGDIKRADGENAATSAEAQAFKRACAAFGLGRYLYELPERWCAYDPAKKQIVDAQTVAARLYREAGLLPGSTPAQAPAPAAPAALARPADAAECERRFFARYGAVVGGSDWPAVQRYLGVDNEQPASVADWIAAAEAVKARQAQAAQPIAVPPALKAAQKRARH